MRSPFRYVVGVAAGVLLLPFLAACGGDSAGESPVGSSGRTQYPLTVQNCGVDLVFDRPPERLLLTRSDDVIPLYVLGVLDRAVARAGNFPQEYYDQAINAAIDRIPLLTDRVDASGHLIISAEVIIDEEPDLLFGLPPGISRENMSDVGILTHVVPALCPTGISNPSFESIYEELRFLGKIFDRNREAEEAVANLEQRVAGLSDIAGSLTGKTAAVLYPTPGDVTTYAYGTKSMAHPQLEALGLKNVFGDTDERVFEVTMEELLGRDPDFLILLHQTADDEAIKRAITSMPGAESLTAVREDAILVQLFNFTEPPSPLAIDGVERIASFFEGR